MIRVLVFFLSINFLTTSVFNSQKSSYKLIVFEGSDWCSNCIRFNKTIIENSDFITYTTNAQIDIEHIDFPQRKSLDKATEAYNASIAEKYDFKGVFPTLILTNDSDDYQILRYNNESAQEFIDLLKSKIHIK